MTDQRFPEVNTAMAVFPSTVGFGWIMFSGPLAPIEWAVSTVARKARGAKAKNEKCLKRLEEHLTKYRPAIVLLEQFEGPESRRDPRIRDLCWQMIALCSAFGIPVKIISREEIAACFTSTKPETRYETALVVASYFKEFGHRLPDPRKSWETEDTDMALFDAAALAVAYYFSQ